MELYDPAFPCDSDLTELSNVAAGQDSTAMEVDNNTPEDFLLSIELPAAKETTNFVQNSESISPHKEPKTRSPVKSSPNIDCIKPSNSDMENSFYQMDDADGEVLEDDTNYRNELKKSTASRQTLDSESKPAKDVPLEMYVGPSVGFRVDLTINKSRKSSVESIARRRHELNENEMFERLSPDMQGKLKSETKRSNGDKSDLNLQNKSQTEAGNSDLGEAPRVKRSDRNEKNTVDFGDDTDKGLHNLMLKEDEEKTTMLALPRVIKVKQTDGKVDDKTKNKSGDVHSSRQSKLNDNDRNDFEFSSRKKIDYERDDVDLSDGKSFGKERRRSKHGRHEVEVESGHRDGNSSKWSGGRESHQNEKEQKRSNSRKHSRDEVESRQRSEERHKSRMENREVLSNRSKSSGKGGKEKERGSGSETDGERMRRKRRSSRSASPRHKKKSRRSKSKSPKWRQERSKSRDRTFKRERDGESRSREHERRHKKRPETTRSKNDDRHMTTSRPKTDDRQRHYRSHSKTPIREIESKKRERLRHSDVKESSFFEDQWQIDERFSRNKSKQPSLRELQERSGSSLFEACMKTRYEKQASNADHRHSEKHRDRNCKGEGEYMSGHNLGQSGTSGGIDYITLSDSDEGIVWTDNEEGFESYPYVAGRSDSSKKQKYEDIYNSRSVQNAESRTVMRSSPKPKNKKKQDSLSPSEIIAINLKKKQNMKAIEKLKITKSVSHSSLEPSEIDDRSSASLSDNSVVEDLVPTKRKVSLKENERCRGLGDKVPIQIHVITSHGDSRGKGEEMALTDCDENVTGVVTTTGETEESVVREKEEQRDDNLRHQKDATSAGEDLNRARKELTDDLAISCGSNEITEPHQEDEQKPQSKDSVSDLDAQNAVPESPSKRQLTHVEREDFKNQLETIGPSNNSSSEFDTSFRSDDISASSPNISMIPGLGDAISSPIGEKEAELAPPSERKPNLPDPPSYIVRKKVISEQSKPSEVQMQKNHSSNVTSPWKSTTRLPKDELIKQTQHTSKKSPMLEIVAAASHQMPQTVLPSFSSQAKVASTGNSSDGNVALEGEPLPSVDRRSKINTSNANTSLSSNTFVLNQNTIADILASFPSTVMPSSSSVLLPPTAPAVTSQNDTSLSKLLACFTSLSGTSASTIIPAQSQKLIEDIMKNTSSVSSQIPVESQSVKSGSQDDQLANIINMQKKLLGLTRISTSTPQTVPPISQKLVQDVFKAVLLPTTSVTPDLLNLRPRVPEIPCPVSDDNSLSQSSPFNVDAASPLSGEILSFSPPSLPDVNSPVKKTTEKPKHHMSKTSHDTKGSAQKTKNKPDKSSKFEDAKEKRSKTEIQKLVVEEVKGIIKPFYSKGRINKDEYKEIMRKTVPKICHSKTQDFSKTRITIYIEAYIRKVMATRKYNAKKKDT